MSLPLACADFTFPLLKHDQCLRLISMLGFEGVDLGLFADRSHLQPNDVIGDPSESARQFAALLAATNLQLADVFLTPGADFQTLAPNHPDAAVRKESREIFQRVLDFTRALNARHMTCLPGAVFDGDSGEVALTRCAQELTWRVAEARRSGVTLSVEAHIGSVAPTPEDALKLLAMTPELTLTLDYGHFVAAGMDQDRVHPLIPHASHFHARCGRHNRLQAALKDNAIDFPRILTDMKRTDYKGYLGVEYVWIDWEHCNEVDNLSETILLRDHLNELMA